MRYAGYGRKRLAPESQRAYGLQAALVMQLAGGVAQEGHARVLCGHAAAVVGHADELRAAAAYLNRYVPGPCVYGVLDKLLDRRRGPLHNLARRDEVRDMRGKYIYSGHNAPRCFDVFSYYN